MVLSDENLEKFCRDYLFFIFLFIFFLKTRWFADNLNHLQGARLATDTKVAYSIRPRSLPLCLMVPNSNVIFHAK